MKDDLNIVNLIFKPKLRIFWHIIFWAFIYFDEILSFTGLTPSLDEKGLFLLTVILNLAIVYFNMYVLLPKLLNSGKLFLYIISSLLCVLIIMYVDNYYYPYSEEYYISEFVSNLVFNSILLSVPVAIKLTKQSYLRNQKADISKTEKLNLEISYLKHQVNPHFLFNTLNSLYIQSKRKNSDVSESLLSFSDLLRYQLYECQKEFVNIIQEVDYLQNYLNLEQRRRDQLEVQFNTELHNKKFQLEPLLFVPLIENAVKYSQTNSKNHAFIFCTLKTTSEETVFQVKNNKGYKTNEESPESGIGLSNLRKRLQLYYPKQHELEIKENENEFEVILTLNNNK